MYEFQNISLLKKTDIFSIFNSKKVTSPTIDLKYEDDSNDGGIAEKI